MEGALKETITTAPEKVVTKSEKGEKGEKGDKGDRGDTGPQGPPGIGLTSKQQELLSSLTRPTVKSPEVEKRSKILGMPQDIAIIVLLSTIVAAVLLAIGLLGIR